MKWDEKYYFFTRICFGSRSSPKLFTLLSKVIHFIATNNCLIRELLYLLDDFLSIDPPGNDGIQTICLLTHLFRLLNIPIHPEKTLGPDSVMVFLSITLDSNKMQASAVRKNRQDYGYSESVYGQAFSNKTRTTEPLRSSQLRITYCPPRPQFCFVLIEFGP